MIKKLLIPITLILVLSVLKANAQKIFFITDVGFEAEAQKYIDVIKTENPAYVATIRTDFGVALTAAQIAQLETADLIIFSRNTNSANYSYPIAWNAIKKPILMTSSFMTRNTRLKWFNTSGTNDADATSVVASDQAHAAFAGINLGVGPISINTSIALSTNPVTNAGNGHVIAVSSTTGNVVIAEWVAGTEFYPGSGYSSPAYRAVFLTGVNYGFSETGKILFINMVKLALGGTGTVPVNNYSWLGAPALAVEGEIVKVVGQGAQNFTKIFINNVEKAGNSISIANLSGEIEIRSTNNDGSEVLKLKINK